MKPDLHLVNGASLGGSLREADPVSGIAFWHEALYMGPLAVCGDEAFATLREAYWERTPSWVLGTPQATHLFPNLTALLPRLADYGRVILWFEFDLYDQAMLWYVLRQFHMVGPVPPLFIISPDSFPGIADFRGLGQLQPEQLATFIGTEEPLDPACLPAAAGLWEAYASGNVDAMRTLLTKPCPLPYAHRALAAHLRQLPDEPDGLGDIQRELIAIIGKHGTPRVYDVIGKIIQAYDRDYGLSDLAALEWLAGLADHPHHPVEFVRDGAAVPWDPILVRETSVRLAS